MPDPSSNKSTTGHTFRPLLIPWPVRAAYQAVAAVSPTSGARFASSLFFRAPRAWAPAKEKAIPGGVPFSVESKGEVVSGTAWGEGPTVLLVHGWAGHAN